MEKRFFIGLCLFFVSACLLSSCNHGSEPQASTPSGVVKAWSKAVMDKDYPTTLKLTDIAEEDFPLYEAWMEMMFDEMDGTSMEVVSQALSDEGDNATVKVTLKSEKDLDTILIRTAKRDGLWKVCLDSDF